MVTPDVKDAPDWLKAVAARAPAPLSSPVVRRSNASAVLKVLQRLGTASRVDLARETGLTSTTAYRLVDHLSSLELIVPAEAELAREGAGRRPAWYRFNNSIASIAALDIGNESTRIAMCDATGAIVAAEQVPTSRLADRLVENVARRITNLARDHPTLGKLVGVTVGIAAIVEQETGVIVRASQYEEWDGMRLKDELAVALGCACSAAQDDHLAALAEFSSLGSESGSETVVVINQGKGVGAGFIINGRLYGGAHGAAGRLESWLLAGEADSRRLGQVLTADALVESYRALGGFQELNDGKSLCAAAEAGDEMALQVVQDLALRLGRVFFQLAVAFDPDVMIFGGGFAGSHELFEPEIRRSLSVRPRPPEFLVSRLGDQAVVRGAIQASLEHVDRYIAEILQSA